MVIVRDFQAFDYDAVLALDVAEQKAFRGDLWERASDREREGLLMASSRNAVVYANSEYCFVAEEGGAIAGFLFALHLLPDVLYVDAVGVASDMRRQGVARELYGSLLARARSRGIRRVQALITPDNEASIALHESVGFVLRERLEAVMEL